VAVIAFTGSKAVGLSIVADASATPAGQRHVKRVIAEMGGKNALIVDAVRSPIGKKNGTLSSIRGDELAALGWEVRDGPQGPELVRAS
jgi:hypothetical protein